MNNHLAVAYAAPIIGAAVDLNPPTLGCRFVSAHLADDGKRLVVVWEQPDVGQQTQSFARSR